MSDPLLLSISVSPRHLIPNSSLQTDAPNADKELLIAYGRDAQDSEYLEREVQRLRAERDALKATYIFRAVWAAFFDTRPSAKFVEEDLKLVRRERARAKFRTMEG